MVDDKPSRLNSGPLSATQLRAIDEVCDRFESACRSAIPPLEEYLAELPSARRQELMVELAAIELAYRRRSGGDWDALLAAHPELANELQRCAVEVQGAVEQRNGSSKAATFRPSHGLHIRCPHCAHPVELLADSPVEDVTCRECGSTFCLVEPEGTEPDSPQPLRTLGRFELVSRLGIGGFGSVWKARDPELDRMVAVKIPRRGQLRIEEAELFFREARAAAQLRHPNIVPVHEIGRADDAIYIVSDFIRGTTLSQKTKTEQPTIAEIAMLGAKIADALDYAHGRGIVHRDLKPSNVMIDEAGEPQLMDFGLAKRETGEVTMTVDGQILGTAAYMSPEQAEGRGHWTDRRADIYSLGVVLFQLATGELPFRGNFDAQLASKLRDDPPDPRKLNKRIPRDFATITLKCLERDPNARYRSAKVVADELRRFLAGAPVEARPISSLQRAWRWARRRPAAAAALALAVTLAVAGPIVAATIERQRRALAARAAELYKLVTDEQEGRRKVGIKIAELESERDAILGKDSGIVRKVAPWRKALIAQVLEMQMDADASTANSAVGDLAAAQHNLAIGMLLAEASRPLEAANHLQSAKSALEKLSASDSAGAAYRAGLADCCEQLAAALRAAGNLAAAQSAADEAVKLRQLGAEESPQAATPAVDLLAAHYEAMGGDADPQDVSADLAAVPDLTKRVLANWPNDPAGLYEAACRLALRTPLLPVNSTAKPAEELPINTNR